MDSFNEFIDLLKSLIRQPSVVGAEHSFSAFCNANWKSAVHESPGMKAY